VKTPPLILKGFLANNGLILTHFRHQQGRDYVNLRW
jgi:hypothetical protein